MDTVQSHGRNTMTINRRGFLYGSADTAYGINESTRRYLPMQSA